MIDMSKDMVSDNGVNVLILHQCQQANENNELIYLNIQLQGSYLKTKQHIADNAIQKDC